MKPPTLTPQSYDSAITSSKATRSTIFSAITGRQGAQMPNDGESSLRGMLIAAYGTSTRDPSRPNVQAAAKSLGVTPRTVQRWIAGETKQHQTPKADTLAKITRKARQAITTKRGRAAATRAARKQYANGLRLTASGIQGVSKDYARPRTVSFDFDTAEMANGFFNAYESRGEEGALEFLNTHSDAGYGVSSWYMGAIDSMHISEPFA